MLFYKNIIGSIKGTGMDTDAKQVAFVQILPRGYVFQEFYLEVNVMYKNRSSNLVIIINSTSKYLFSANA